MLIDQIDERWQRHHIARLHLEPLFKSEHVDGVGGRDVTHGHPLMHRPSESEVDNSAQLIALLKGLGVGADVVEASIKRNDASITRAAAIIAEWMTYLPEDCVKAMVNDGWHWST